MEQVMKGKVALITGGAAGIGLATALKFAQNGAHIVVVDINAEQGELAISRIKELGGSGVFCRTDISKSDHTRKMIETAVTTFGGLDFAVNNAGVGGSAAGCRGRIDEIDEQPWRLLMDINLTGTWLCMKYEIIQMKKQKKGVIVNVASALGLVGMPNTSAYVASKHAVIGMTRSAALEYMAENIRINAICPGWTDTTMAKKKRTDDSYQKSMLSRQPIGRMGHPEEIADAIFWLCSEESSFVVGAALSIDGGWTAQ